jgi:heme exporter protein B
MLNVDSVSGLCGEALGVLTLSLLLGTPTLSFIGAFIGAIGAALTLGVRGSSVLIALLVLPLCIPVRIFGVGTATSRTSEIGAGAHLSLLGAGLLLALAPWATATSLWIALE